MDEYQAALIRSLEKLIGDIAANKIHSLFAIAIGEDGPIPVVLVEPEFREDIIIALNAELTNMLGSPHHIASADKIHSFLRKHNITDADLLNFKFEEE